MALGFKENGIVAPLLTALSLWFLGREKREYLKLALFLVPVPFYLWLRHAATDAGVLDAGAAAELLFKRAIERAPGSEPAYVQLAGLYLRQGKEAQALEIYEALLRLNPYSREALNDAGIINAKNGRYEAAGALFRKALEIEPGSKSAAANLERLESLKNPRD